MKRSEIEGRFGFKSSAGRCNTPQMPAKIIPLPLVGKNEAGK